MKDKEFIDWLKGFTEGVHHYNISPKQWDYLKSKLETVGESNNSYYIDKSKWITNSTQ